MRHRAASDTVSGSFHPYRAWLKFTDIHGNRLLIVGITYRKGTGTRKEEADQTVGKTAVAEALQQLRPHLEETLTGAR